MTPYLAAVLALLTTQPGALALNMLWIMFLLHVAVPVSYLIFRALGFQWDGIEWGWRLLVAVSELRRAQAVRRVGWAVGVVVMFVVSEL